MLIEQAIFTSACTRRMNGYQLAAASPDISHNDLRDLSHWGPAHDSLLVDSHKKGSSINFHPLTSGAMCISQTVSAGTEYSGRGGGRIYSQCFVVAEHLLQRFAGNPFRLLEAIAVDGHISVLDEIPEQLEPISLIGKASVVDRTLLNRLVESSGVETLPALIGALLATDLLGVISDQPTKLLFAGLINVLPVECRAEVSFSTGLKQSTSRPFRMIAMEPNTVTMKRARRTSEPVPLDLAKEVANPSFPSHPWAELVRRLLRHGKVSTLSKLLDISRPGLRLDQLDYLGRQLLAEVPVAQG